MFSENQVLDQIEMSFISHLLETRHQRQRTDLELSRFVFTTLVILLDQITIYKTITKVYNLTDYVKLLLELRSYNSCIEIVLNQIVFF